MDKCFRATRPFLFLNRFFAAGVRDVFTSFLLISMEFIHIPHFLMFSSFPSFINRVASRLPCYKQIYRVAGIWKTTGFTLPIAFVAFCDFLENFATEIQKMQQ
jgi:hypothetical protein